MPSYEALDAEIFLNDLSRRGYRIGLSSETGRICIDPANPPAEIVEEIKKHGYGILRVLRRKIDWLAIEAAASGADGSAWNMAAVYTEAMGSAHNVTSRWADLIYDAPHPVGPDMLRLRDRAIQIIYQRQWVQDAIALGWSEREMLGVHPDSPRARIDCQGAVVSVALDPSVYRINQVHKDHIVLVRARAFKGERKSVRTIIHPRRLPGIRETVPFWELLERSAAMPDESSQAQ